MVCLCSLYIFLASLGSPWPSSTVSYAWYTCALIESVVTAGVQWPLSVCLFVGLYYWSSVWGEVSAWMKPSANRSALYLIWPNCTSFYRRFLMNAETWQTLSFLCIHQCYSLPYFWKFIEEMKIFPKDIFKDCMGVSIFFLYKKRAASNIINGWWISSVPKSFTSLL